MCAIYRKKGREMFDSLYNGFILRGDLLPREHNDHVAAFNGRFTPARPMLITPGIAHFFQMCTIWLECTHLMHVAFFALHYIVSITLILLNEIEYHAASRICQLVYSGTTMLKSGFPLKSSIAR